MSREPTGPVAKLGPYLQHLRLARGTSSEELAQLVGIPLHTIERLEQGSNPGARVLRRLCDELEISFTALLERLYRQSTQSGAGARVVGHTPEQRRAALAASGASATCADDLLPW